MTLPLGPVEFLLIGFEDGNFRGDISPALAELVERGFIRLIDLAVVTKSPSGEVAILEMQELTDEVAEAVRKLNGEVRGLLSEADLQEVAEALEPGSTVAALLVEHLWADRFAQAVRAEGGELIIAERIPGRLVEQARETLLTVAHLA